MPRNGDDKIQIRNSTNDFLIFSKENGGDGVDVLVADENVWLTQKSICSLYDTSKSTVSGHLTNIFKGKELDEDSTVRNFRTVASNGMTYNYKDYNLQAIIAVGFKGNSEKAIGFRAWAADVLADFDKFLQEANIDDLESELDARNAAHKDSLPVDGSS